MIQRLFATVIVLLLVAGSAGWAIQPFYDAFKEKYGQPGTPLEKPIQATKCNICHIDKKPKKERNDYGQAVGKHLKKADFAGEKKKFDPKTPAGKQALDDGLNAAGEEKAPDGRKFAEIIKGGALP